MQNKLVFEKDLSAKKIHVVREFNAPIAKVWAAWTRPELLDQWWGPKPWAAQTESLDFRVGGMWIYAMVGPEGQRFPSEVKFTAIEDGRRFTADTGVGHWDTKFEQHGNITTVTIDIDFDDEEGLKMLLDMGFQGGFTIGLNQLESLLAA